MSYPLFYSLREKTMKVYRIAKIIGKRIHHSTRSDAFFCCFSLGVAAANFAACTVAWHPFHCAVALLGLLGVISFGFSACREFLDPSV